jgi:predicted CopG family antitoxin
MLDIYAKSFSNFLVEKLQKVKRQNYDILVIGKYGN